MKGLHTLAFILLIVGGLNWLLVGLFSWDVGQLLGGMDAPISRALYVLVGLAAVVDLVTHKAACRKCTPEKGASAPPPGQPTSQLPQSPQ